MARKENDLNVIGFTQQFDLSYWDWDQAESSVLDEVRQGRREAKDAGDIILKRLKGAGMEVAEMYVIKHDKDVVEEWSDADKKAVMVGKTMHMHGVVKFTAGKGGTIGAIASAMGLQPQYVEKAGKGRYAYDNMLAYLIHVKYTDKHQYDPSEVCTVVGKEYALYCKERMAEWVKGRASVQRKRAVDGIDGLEEKILTGEVVRNQVLLTDELFAIYSRNKRRCDDAFAVYAERKAALTMQALSNGEFKLTVFFIYGSPGAGKTSVVAEGLIKETIRYAKATFGEAWTCYKTAATNPMDDYDGSEIILMDDVRGGAMCAEDWLHLLDPYNITRSSARYYNKTAAPRVLLITSTKDPMEFFYYCRQAGGGDRSELLDQFLRRIQSLLTVIRTDDYMNPLVCISDSFRGEERRVRINGGAAVDVSYGFRDADPMPKDTAMQVLMGKIEVNNLPEDARKEVLKYLWDNERYLDSIDGMPPEQLAEWNEMPEPDELSYDPDLAAVLAQSGIILVPEPQ